MSSSRKSHRCAVNDGAETEEQGPVLIPTNVENVHEISGKCPTMESIRSEISDWNDPVILVITV